MVLPYCWWMVLRHWCIESCPECRAHSCDGGGIWVCFYSFYPLLSSGWFLFLLVVVRCPGFWSGWLVWPLIIEHAGFDLVEALGRSLSANRAFPGQFVPCLMPAFLLTFVGIDLESRFVQGFFNFVKILQGQDWQMGWRQRSLRWGYCWWPFLCFVLAG